LTPLQGTYRDFLSGSDDKSKYKFFLTATLLEQMKETNESNAEVGSAIALVTSIRARVFHVAA
jgi:hypothetical protein